ncbi:hypothetical protein [Salinispora oceanensis]|uniref:hypothetical protein n=1 Tax=Salinispora oceanensis TaxID=1050199 RepID=UPI0003815A9A|nr:hypothetical protein [Salinispora oceanensis]
MSVESAAIELLAALGRYQLEIEKCTVDFWLCYDFGDESEAYSFLDLHDSDEVWQRVGVSKTIRIPVSMDPYLENEIQFRLTLAFSKSGCNVESRISAHLDERMGRWEPGSHVLYRKLSEGLSFAAALEIAPRHIEALYYETPEIPESLGLSRR